MAKIEDFNKKAALFLAKFFAIYAVLQLAILAAPIGLLEESIAFAEAKALGVESSGNSIFLNGHVFEIVQNCTGLASISVLASIVFALRKPNLRKKAALFAIGAAALFPLNLARVYLVLLAAMLSNPEIAESLHIASWFTTSAIILALWYLLTKKVAKVQAFHELL